MRNWLNWLIALFVITLLVLTIPLLFSGDDDEKQLLTLFNDYIEKFNKSYKNNATEYATRYQHFVASVQEIKELNSLSRGPEEHRARFGLTRLSDMSKDEYREIHLSDEKLKKSPQLYGKSWRNDGDHHKHRNQNEVYSRKKRMLLPLQVDWRSKGVIGQVYNQGLCGACWAFTTVGVMEAMNAIHTGTLVPLSVQQAVDCAGLGNMGCLGGDICLLLDWLSLTKTPIETEKQYPLQTLSGVCKLPKNVTGVKVASFTCDDFVGAEDKILQAIATHGPVAVAVNGLTWQNYLGGVIQYHCSGAPSDLNHAVELVGYNLDADVPYYIAKNSWGTEFGNGGYLHLAVGSNICGLANEVATIDVK